VEMQAPPSTSFLMDGFPFEGSTETKEGRVEMQSSGRRMEGSGCSPVERHWYAALNQASFFDWRAYKSISRYWMDHHLCWFPCVL
jgi:hypothetical protein